MSVLQSKIAHYLQHPHNPRTQKDRLIRQSNPASINHNNLAAITQRPNSYINNSKPKTKSSIRINSKTRNIYRNANMNKINSERLIQYQKNQQFDIKEKDVTSPTSKDINEKQIEILQRKYMQLNEHQHPILINSCNAFQDGEIRRSINLPKDENRSCSIRRQLLFLREIVKKKKQKDAIQIERSKSYSHINPLSMIKLNQSDLKNGITADKNIQKQKNRLLEGHALKNINSVVFKNSQEYEHYDIIVRDLLSEIKIRNNNNQGKRKRPLISPSKYSESKGKLKIKYSQMQHCNFKSAIKMNHTAVNKKDTMTFGMTQSLMDTVYEKKIASYILFLYKINYSNAVYVDLSLTGPRTNFINNYNEPASILSKTIGSSKFMSATISSLSNAASTSNLHKKQKPIRYKVKIGGGNNSELIKGLIKRRFWMEIATDEQKQKYNFVWTQGTLESYHQQQKTFENKSQEELVREKISIPSKKYIKKVKKLLKNSEKKLAQDNINGKIFMNPAVQESIRAQKNFYSCNYGAYSNVHKNIKPELITNHIPYNFIIGSKKVLFMLMAWYYQEIKKIDPFQILPKTYHLRSGPTKNQSYKKFLEIEGENIDSTWIIKPGENTNRGNGIVVANLSEINKLISKKQVHKNGEQKTYIIQKYLKPFLYNGRKFDLRHYVLITSVNGYIKAYWFRQGYLRTSCEKYDLDDLGNQFIHLTNDAIQKKSSLYGKYEPGNKLSYQNFQRYLDQTYPSKKYSFESKIVSKMKQITRDLIEASFSFLDPERKSSNFQLFGMDFMIDSKFDPYLIQVNANPCLETSCPLLQRIVPVLLQHTLRIGLDPLFPPPEHYPINSRYQLSDRILEKLKYEIIFDERVDGEQLREVIQQNKCKFFKRLYLSKSKNKINIKIQEQESNSQKNTIAKIDPYQQIKDIRDVLLFEPDEEIFDNDGEEIKDMDLE